MAISKEQFYKEVHVFRDQMGQKTFWENPEKAELAQKALGICYLSVDWKTKEELEQLAIIYEACMTEFSRRDFYMSMSH